MYKKLEQAFLKQVQKDYRGSSVQTQDQAVKGRISAFFDILIEDELTELQKQKIQDRIEKISNS